MIDPAEGETPADLRKAQMTEPDSRPHTGDPRVDAVLDDLDALADLPVHEHARVYDTIHARLRDVLLDTPDDPAPEHEA